MYVTEDDIELSDDVRVRHWKAGRRWNGAVITAQIVSAGAFAAGIVVPLVWMTIHLR
jgi:hypothetical protein